MKKKSTLRHFLLLAGSSLLAISSASAGPIDWDGGGADDNLTTPENWVGDPDPVDKTSIFKFGGDTRNAPVNDYAVDEVLGSPSSNLFWFTNDGSAGRTNAFTLTGNPIKTNTGNGVILTSAITTGPTITDTVDIDMTLQGNLIAILGTGHDLTISGDLSELSAGNRQFIKDGDGNLTLSGNNSFTSTFSIFAGGTVNIDTLTNANTPSSIGTANNILFNKSTNATLNYTGAATSTDRALNLGGNGNFANNGRFTNNGTGAVVFSRSVLNSSFGVNIATPRTLFLGGANTDANKIIGGIRNNTGDADGKVVSLIKEDAGTWIMFGNNSELSSVSPFQPLLSYTGGTTINAGILQFANTRSMSYEGTVAVNDTATLAVSAGSASYLGRFEFTNATSGAGSIGGLLAGVGGLGAPVTYTGNVRLGIDTTRATGESLTYSGVIPNVGTSLGLTKLGAGTLVLSAANTFSGNTLVTDDTDYGLDASGEAWTLFDYTSLTPTNAKIKLGNALALQYSAYDTASIPGGLDVTGYPTPTLGGLTGSVDLSSTLITGYGSVTNLKLNPQTGITQTYSGVIADGATGMILTKTGAGDQILTNANTYTGDTFVTEGKLILGGSNTGKLGGGTYAGAITLGTGATLQKDSGGTQILTGAITGLGSLVLNSGGELIINNAGNNFGNLTMTSSAFGGRIFLANPGSLTGATVTLDGGTFVFNGGASGTYGNAIKVADAAGISARASTGVVLDDVTLPASGIVKFNNDDATTHSVEITNNKTLSGALTVEVGGDKMLTGTAALGEVIFSGNIDGSGSLTMTSSGNVGNTALYGSGVLNLTGSIGYSGDTTVNSGTLSLGQNNTANDASTVTIGTTPGATLDLNFAGADTVDQLFFGATQQPSGTYGASGVPAGATITTASFSGTGTLSVTSTGQTSYEAWANGATFDGEANGDGVKDGLAFLLGAATPGTNALGLLPTVSQSGGTLIMTFDCLATADRGASVLKLEYDGDLVAPWTSAEVPGAVGNTTVGNVSFVATANGSLIHIVATINDATEAAAGKLFSRLEGNE